MVRAFRLLRVFRILKLIQFLYEGNILKKTLKASLYKIVMFLSSVITLVHHWHPDVYYRRRAEWIYQHSHVYILGHCNHHYCWLW